MQFLATGVIIRQAFIKYHYQNITELSQIGMSRAIMHLHWH